MAHIHHHYFTLEQRAALERIVLARAGTPQAAKVALERLHTADYGVCVKCGTDIPYAQLHADPDAMHCRDCARLPTPT